MPKFQINIPQEFLFIPANLSFISFCLFISFLLFRVFRSKIVFFIVFISLTSAMYSDIFVKHGLKFYYEKFVQTFPSFIKASKNEDNKIDSLSTIKVYNYPLKFSSSLEEKEKQTIINAHEHYISQFIDISTYRYRFNKYHYNQERLYLNYYKYDNTSISDTKGARFTISLEDKKDSFSDYYSRYDYVFVDTEFDQTLARANHIKFDISLNKIRNRYLFWDKQKELDFNPKPINNFELVYKKVFIE